MNTEKNPEESFNQAHNSEVNHNGIDPVAKLGILSYYLTDLNDSHDSCQSIHSW